MYCKILSIFVCMYSCMYTYNENKVLAVAVVIAILFGVIQLSIFSFLPTCTFI